MKSSSVSDEQVSSHGCRTAREVSIGETSRRTAPISPEWGADRGRCIDRYYIEQFLEEHAADIAGVVLEVHDNDYAELFGGGRVIHGDVLDIDETNPRATVVADLRNAAAIPSHKYDCFVMTQTLHVIDDLRRALTECVRILKPGGVLLATLPCASRMAPEYGADGDFWRFTTAGARMLFQDFFLPDDLKVRPQRQRPDHDCVSIRSCLS